MSNGEICADPFGPWRTDREPAILENRPTIEDTMVQVAQPSLPTELPREVRAELDPKLEDFRLCRSTANARLKNCVRVVTLRTDG